jgi:Cyclin
LYIIRLFLSAIVIAIKYHEDEYYKNDFYAKVGGISLEEFNRLEEYLLINLNYKLFIDENAYSIYTTRLEMFADL